MRYWLMKSEGSCYSIDHLKGDRVTPWSGVRNYQARNFMMRDMKTGDKVLFYHSDDTPSGIYGLAKVTSGAKPDTTQFDANDMHYEPRATKEKPIWYCVDISFVRKFKEPVSLAELKFDPALEGMLVRAKGSRLSIQPVSEAHYRHIVEIKAKRKRG